MIEARYNSLFQRLKTRGLFEVVMRELSDQVKDAKTMTRWLKSEGIATSPGAVYAMWKNHGEAYRYETAMEAAAAQELSDDIDVATQQMLRRKLFTETMQAEGIKALQILAQISGDSEKLKQAERKVRVAEAALELKRYEAQLKGAEILESAFAGADELQALKAERDALRAGGAGEAEVIELIRRRMYGEGAAPEPKGERRAA